MMFHCLHKQLLPMLQSRSSEEKKPRKTSEISCIEHPYWIPLS
uniref:Uncharacterized protein n=1 Tax=Anguilla anguilla TaxID=7936 RepID=A0A0E9QEQ2_ANGAN